MRIASFALAFLLAATVLRAAVFVGDQTFSAPFTSTDAVTITGNLTLATPGVYSAPSWNVVGNVRFTVAGTYTFTASTGGLTITGNVVGPASGSVTVHVSYRTGLVFLGTASANIIVVDDNAANLTPPTPGASGAAPLVNISTRATLGAGQILTPGFVIGGSVPRRVLIRAIGPGLAPFGVTNAMPNPVLTVLSGPAVIGASDNWGGGDPLAAVFAGVGAFALPANSKDAAVVLTLPPGNYTAQIRGATATDAGEVLVEIYFVD